MKLAVDGMLGKLARWLRMLGYDVKYFNDLADDQLIATAEAEKRILLTRDYELYRRASVRGLEAFLVKGQTEAEKLAELAERYGIRLEIDPSVSRCPKCNTMINSVLKEEVREKIPESTSRFYDEFWICPNCGQVYWRGSHWSKISRTLQEARQIVQSTKKLNSSFS